MLIYKLPMLINIFLYLAFSDMTFTIGETNIGSEMMISSDKFHKHRYIYILTLMMSNTN
jgi:hypothetical protein